MAINFESTVLITDNLESMKLFYTDVMRQEIEFDFGNCIGFKCGLSLWQLQEHYPLTKALGARPANTRNDNVEMCFDTDDYDTEVAHIRASGAQLLHDPACEPWGQYTLRFFDPDRNIVELGESIPCFCRRLYNSGLDASAVAKKTGIPNDVVLTFLSE